MKSSGVAKFSFVSVDLRTTPYNNTITLLSGEYQKSSSKGRLFRWKVDEKTGRIQPKPVAAYKVGYSKMQGAVSQHGIYWANTSGKWPKMRNGRIGKKVTSYKFPRGVEDLMYESNTMGIWGLSEHPKSRYVWMVKNWDYSKY